MIGAGAVITKEVKIFLLWLEICKKNRLISTNGHKLMIICVPRVWRILGWRNFKKEIKNEIKFLDLLKQQKTIEKS